MNKDRRHTCQMLGNVCKAHTKAPNNKVLFALKESVDSLIATEQRSIEKMEPHIEKPATRINWKLATLSKDYLEQAAEALVDGDMEDAAENLLAVAEGREYQEEEDNDSHH